MPVKPDPADLEFQNHSLQNVSRTFALTIPQLPPAIHPVVGNAYLLCRIADTIEDDQSLSSEQKDRFSERFIDVVNERQSADRFARDLAPLISTQMLDAERELVSRTATVIRITHSFNDNQRRAIERCIRIMSRGMAEFQRDSKRRYLADLPQLDDYCYHVAGIVGEMLTEFYCDYSQEIALHRDRMMKLSVSFGQGLQMTNILKDIWDDQQRGACWLPQDLFMRAGFDLGELQTGHRSPAFEEGLRQLIGIATAHLGNALEYTLLLPRHEKGIRRFCLWALGMAIMTLRKINAHRDFCRSSDVKISRRTVKSTILSTNLAVSNDAMLRLLFNLASRGLPKLDINGQEPSLTRRTA